ncbi:MAG: response regulator [Candidatus Hodarchaeales archaeon]
MEDDFDLLNLYKLYFESKGHIVLRASNTEQTLAQLKKKPDVILIDIYLESEFAGIKICQKIRNDNNLKSIPLIICSGYYPKTIIQKGLKAGADKYFVKPISFTTLEVALNKLIHQKKIE